MKIYVLGHKGMLGRYVYTYLKSKGHTVIGFSRDDVDASNGNEEALRATLFHKGLKKDDVVINCMGTIKPMVDKHGALNAIKVNSIFPRILANVCENEGYKMIHITTDCVFSGDRGKKYR
jgi:dTDP-4-dehydrorhamnose reductase